MCLQCKDVRLHFTSVGTRNRTDISATLGKKAHTSAYFGVVFSLLENAYCLYFSSYMHCGGTEKSCDMHVLKNEIY